MRSRYRVVRTALERQELRKEWLLWGVVVWYATIDFEVIPSFAWIANACLGGSEWVSKFAPFGKDGVK